MPRINVFVSYVDSFVGKRVLAQFEQCPSAYHVYGCTWDKAAAEKLNAAAATAASHTHDSHANDVLHTANANAEALSTLDLTDEATRSMRHDSRGTLTPCELSRADTAPQRDDLSHGGDDGDDDGVVAHTGAAGLSPPVSASPAPASSSSFFSRHDVASTRAALLASDWIIVELRQAQTVLELVQFLQLQTSFVRPKRLVLLSSLMTWYATPALSGTGGDGAAGSGDAGEEEDAGADNDNGDDGAAQQDDEEGANGGVEAPFPPPPSKSLEKLLHAAQDAARRAVVDAMRGGGTGAGGAGGGNGEGDATERDQVGEEEDDAAAAADGGDGRAEVLTEDQYNRRVPHLHYMSWRDAEKAVAAAHHAKGLPLDTFVVCSGLPYGGEEDALEPLFRLAWSAQPAKDGARVTDDTTTNTTTTDPCNTAVLPIFGDGSQRVPLVHAQDLACFVRKLLRCPASGLPFPERRYLFATDGTNSNSWTSIVSGVNRMFGGRCALQPVPPKSYPLYRDVDKFTLNVRVEAESMKALMERQDDKEEEGGAAVRLPNTWVAEGGLSRHLRAVAHEFATARGVTPLRIAVVGPPLVGKTYLATRLATHYRLPCVALASIVAEYTAAMQALQHRAETTKAAVLQAERTRRLGLKRRRVLLRQQREWDAAVDAAAAGSAGATSGGAAADDDDANADDASSNTDMGQGRAAAPGVQQEVAANAFELSAAEEEEMTRFVQEWWVEQPQVQAWASKVAEMQRVLLLRLHQRPPTPDANPKRRAGGGGNGGGSGKKKANTGKDAQKSREEEEELQQLKASLQNAPFQTRALAIMLRWRLAQPDCCVQGFVLDGVPATLELARMVFGEDNGEAVQPPATEEEALKPRYAGESTGAAGGGGEAGEDTNDGGDGKSGAGPAAAKEVASDARLPNHVVVLQASDTYLLSRMRAMGVAAERQLAGTASAEPASPTTPSSLSATSNVVDVETFQHDLQTYKREYEEATYSVLSYWECAAATSTIEGITGPERRAEVHLVTVEGHEPLVPAPPPTSAYAEVPVGDTELLLRQVIVGPPHNFGKSLEEMQRDAVRQRCLQEEQDRAHAKQAAARAAAESTECAQEQQTRAATRETLAALKAADLAELEKRKQPMTRYLQERVLPLLHKGLLEVCASRPEDPVDFLAEWLIRHNPHDDTFSDI